MMGRHHVQLPADAETAARVGARHGKPVVLEVAAARMAADGHVFLRSANGVWLTDTVPPPTSRPAENSPPSGHPRVRSFIPPPIGVRPRGASK